MDRREFVETFAAACAAGLPILLGVVKVPGLQAQGEGAGSGAYDPKAHTYGMAVDTTKCIGCARCVNACKTENDVPREPGSFNTWIERYVIRNDGEVVVDSPNGGLDGFPPETTEVDMEVFER